MGDIIFNVNSANQMGGITAGMVVPEKPPRLLNDFSKASLNASLKELHCKNGDKIAITVAWGDQEAYNFGLQVKSFLDDNGYITNDVLFGLPLPILTGQRIDHIGNNEFAISIGKNG